MPLAFGDRKPRAPTQEDFERAMVEIKALLPEDCMSEDVAGALPLI